MKNIITVAILASLALFIAACDNEPDKKCDCIKKEHLGINEKCCNLKECICEPMVYGEVVDNVVGIPGESRFPIYRQGEVTDMEAVVAKVVEGYSGLDYAYRVALHGKIKEVRIIPGNDRNRFIEDGKFIIEFGEERSAASMEFYFEQTAEAVGDLAMVPVTTFS